MKTKLLLSTLTLSACAGLGDIEKQAIRDKAIEDAQKLPRVVRLAYLNCYALPEVGKKACKREVKFSVPELENASTIEYIRTFGYEGEKLGFKAFLDGKGKPCVGINHGPEYDNTAQAYRVECTDGNSHHMAFDSKQGKWLLK